MELLRLIRGPNDDYDIEALMKIVTTGNHRSYLALDAVPRHCIPVSFANGDPDSCLVGNVLSVMDDVVLASDVRSGLNNGVEFLMFQNPVFTLHQFTLKIPVRELVSNLCSALSPTTSKDLAAIVIGHLGAESGLVGVLHFRRLISFLHTHFPPKFTCVRIDYRFSGTLTQ